MQIVTFAIRNYLKQAPNSPTRSGPYELHYYAAVLPKTCVLTPPTSSNLDDKFLFKEFHLLSSDGATSKLLETVEKKIGMMLETYNGRICVSPLELTGEDKVDETPVDQQATSKTPPLPVVAPKEPVETVQPEEADTPIAFPGAIVPEQTKLFFQALLEKPPPSSTRRGSWGTATTLPGLVKRLDSKPAGNTRGEFLRSIEQNPLTAYNLSLLENEHKNTESKSPKKCRPKVFPLVQKKNKKETKLTNTLKPQRKRPIIVPKLATNIESSPKSPRATTTPLELNKRITELEEKLHALDTLVKTQQMGLFHFREPPGPIMTPATSVASTEVKLVAELESEVPLPPTSGGGGLGARAFLFA